MTLQNTLIVLLTQPLVIFSTAAASKKLSAILEALEIANIPYSISFKATILSNGSCLILPARLSELLKPIYIRNYNNNIKLGKVLSSVLIERLMDILILGVFSLVGAIFFLKINILSIATVLALVLSMILVIIYFEVQIIKLLKLFLYRKFQNISIDIVQTLNMQLRNRKMLRPLFYGLIAWLLSFLNIAILLIALDCAHIGLKGFLEVFLGSIFGGAIPALPAGFGTYEASVVYILKDYDINFNKALAVALTLHISQLIFPVLGTIVVMFFENIGIRKMIDDAKAFSRT